MGLDFFFKLLYNTSTTKNAGIIQGLGFLVPNQAMGVRIPLLAPESSLKKAAFPFLKRAFEKLHGDSKQERYRATVRWTVVTATDQAAQFAARIESPYSLQKRSSLKRLFLFLTHSAPMGTATAAAPRTGTAAVMIQRTSDSSASNAAESVDAVTEPVETVSS